MVLPRRYEKEIEMSIQEQIENHQIAAVVYPDLDENDEFEADYFIWTHDASTLSLNEILELDDLWVDGKIEMTDEPVMGVQNSRVLRIS
jgi:hypothetical protein